MGVAVIEVDEDDAWPVLKRLRFTEPNDVELNLSVSGMGVGDCCIAASEI